VANAAEGIASEDFYIDVPEATERRHVQMWLTRPEETEDGVWVCRVDANEVVRGPRIGVHGASSLQALCLALRLARQQLMDFRDSGGRLYCAEDGQEELALEALFGDSIG